MEGSQGSHIPPFEVDQTIRPSLNGDSPQAGLNGSHGQRPEKLHTGPHILRYADSNGEHVSFTQVIVNPDDVTNWLATEDPSGDDSMGVMLRTAKGGRLYLEGDSLYDFDNRGETGRLVKIHDLGNRSNLPHMFARGDYIGNRVNKSRIVGVEVPLSPETAEEMISSGTAYYENGNGEENILEVAGNLRVAHALLDESDLKVAHDLLEEARIQPKEANTGFSPRTDLRRAPELLPILEDPNAFSVVNGAKAQRPVPNQSADHAAMSRFNFSRLPQAKGFLRNVWDRKSEQVAYRVNHFNLRKLVKKLGSLSLPGASLPGLPKVQNARSRIGEYFTDEQKGRRRQKFTALGLTAVMAAGVAVSTSDHGADKLPVEGGATVEAATIKPPSRISILEALHYAGSIRNISSPGGIKAPANKTTVRKGQSPWAISTRQLKLSGNPHPTKTQTANYDQRLLDLNGITPYEAHYIQPGTELELPPG